MFRRARGAGVVVLLPVLSGCMSLVASFTADFAKDLGNSILDNSDVEMVREGAPAYLLLVDAMVKRSPDNASLLAQSARLNAAYAAAFVSDSERARLLAGNALDAMDRAVCLDMKQACGLRTRPYEDYEAWLNKRTESDVPALYQLGVVWAGWIQANSDDFAAIAELGRVKALMARVAELDGSYDYGGAYLYLGVFETLLPPSLGGRPEEGRSHFEKAIEISEGKFLMAKVMYADQYARLMFDRELHDRLLREVLAADPNVPGLTLINAVAQQRADELLESADDYF